MKSLPQNRGILAEEPEYFGVRCFSAEAIRQFPELASELTKDAHLLHVQMGTLAGCARSAIERGDPVFLRRVIAFLDEVLSRHRIHPEIENAVATSFLAPADFETSETGRQAWGSLPERVRHALQRAA
jgi:hypothetical protein